MTATISSDQGKQKAVDAYDSDDSPSELDSSSSSGSSSDSSSESDFEDEDLGSLLEKARQSARAKAAGSSTAVATAAGDELVLTLERDDDPEKIPSLNPGPLPRAYFELGKTRRDPSSLVLDPEVELSQRAASSIVAPAPPRPPPELTKSGKPLTKKEIKSLKRKTAGSDWFNLPAPDEAELPKLHREVEALRLRNQLDPKRFYRKDEGEGKGIKGLPKYFAIGTVLPSSTPFGGASSDNLPRSQRKRTLVDELVDDAEAQRYAKKKFNELQTVRGAKGKNTLAAKQARRKPKW
ncbi:Fcf2 pre-rRNA processing-domain-containing protein [Pterulicium gracile]|uniref:Fcf2 pre-rRNA processing-domain-containing protein n=1 Tax=Pterulicium gracile TaxID=1884261 RepID=A0A5C3QVH4_9AGAR|nr:Fcf2 pre-rRNA processing-domain-containing protein [Pterula gracilis]